MYSDVQAMNECCLDMTDRLKARSYGKSRNMVKDKWHSKNKDDFTSSLFIEYSCIQVLSLPCAQIALEHKIGFKVFS